MRSTQQLLCSSSRYTCQHAHLRGLAHERRCTNVHTRKCRRTRTYVHTPHRLRERCTHAAQMEALDASLTRATNDYEGEHARANELQSERDAMLDLQLYARTGLQVFKETNKSCCLLCADVLTVSAVCRRTGMNLST